MSARICRTLPYGATVQERRGPLWTKVGERVWEDAVDGAQTTNVDLDRLLATGRAELVVQQVNLATEEVPAFEVEAGEYVVFTFGFWMQGEGVQLFDTDERVAQQLWRVAGWTDDSPRAAAFVVDGPEQLQRWTNHLMCPEGSWEAERIQVPVSADTMIRVVSPGQEVEDWSGLWDWELHWGSFCEPPVLV